MSPEGFRELRHACLLNRKACAAFLGVCERTVRHWDAGRNRVPWSAVRLLRLLRCGDLGALHDGWAGWTLTPRGELVSLNGYRFQPGRLALWPILCEQARFWRADYAQRAGRGCGGEAPAGALQPEAGMAAHLAEVPRSPPPEPLSAELLSAFPSAEVEGGPAKRLPSRSDASLVGAAFLSPVGSPYASPGCGTGAEVAQWRGLAPATVSACVLPRDVNLIASSNQNPYFHAPGPGKSSVGEVGPSTNRGQNGSTGEAP